MIYKEFKVANLKDQPKVNKFFLTLALISILTIVLILLTRSNQESLNLFGQAQSNAQIIKSWSFDQSTEGWKSRFTRDANAKNGSLNVRIGQSFFTPLIFNRRVLTQLPLPLKYFSINLAIQKRKEANIRPNQPTLPPVIPLTNEDIQILNLPEQTILPSGVSDTGACISDVRVCPDGTYVGRVAPTCDFLPCTPYPPPFFTFNVHFKTINSPYWSHPLPITGKISSNFMEYTIRIPVFNPLIIEAIKIEFKSGISRGDIILIDSIKLLNEKLTFPSKTPTPTAPPQAGCNELCPANIQCAEGLECLSSITTETTPSADLQPTGESNVMPPIPAVCRNPKCPFNPDCSCGGSDITPTYTPPPCVSPPACAYGGISDEFGNRLYCDPSPVTNWCPIPSISIVPEPCIPRPPCADGIPSPEGYVLYCMPPVDRLWCVKPTLTEVPTETPIPPPCAVPTLPECTGGTIQASADPQTPGVCPPKYICVFPESPTP